MDWKIVLSAVLLVVILIIALSMRKKITRNEDNEGMFKPYRLKVEGEDKEEAGEEGENEDEENDEE